MQVTTADLWAPAPGEVLRWEVRSTGPGRPVPLSLNQRNHLAVAAAGEPSVWLAASFDVDGPIDPRALGRALRAFVRRHSSLQVAAVRDADGIAGVRHDPVGLTWTPVPGPVTTDVDGTRRLVRRLLAEGCRPFDYPAFQPLAISRPTRSTVVLGMDHLHCDAYSLTVVVDELAALYDAFRSGTSLQLPAAESFVREVEAEAADPVRVWPDDDRLRTWHSLLRARDFSLPTFPLPLGVPAGERVPQAALVRRLAGVATMTEVSRVAREAGTSTYAVALSTLASALQDLGGPDRLDLLAPVQTRTGRARRTPATTGRAVGWYTTTVPLSVPAEGGTAGIVAAGEAVRQGVRIADVPLDQVLGSLPQPLVRTRGDVFMVSWIDYRHLPGGAQAEQRNAHHISAPTLADDVQIWLSRTHAGLAVRVRIPDTVVARESAESLLDAWSARLAALVVDPAPVRG